MRTNRRRLVTVDAERLAQAVMLFNDKPRFGPRNRRLHFDSYQLAEYFSTVLRQYGFHPNDPVLFEED